MSGRLPLVVVGCGAIGQVHARLASRHAHWELAAVVDPAPAAAGLAGELGVPWFAELQDCLSRQPRPAAAVVATPNATHAELGEACLRAGLPVLVEKPLAGSESDALRLVRATRETGLPVLVGHQRRHSPRVLAARACIAAGGLGRVVAAQVMATWFKPSSYFQADWRRQPGGGPVLINLIHDIDLLRYLLGPVHQVQAMVSGAVRGHAVEDSAAVLLRMGQGTVATLVTSDCAAAPWNYDLASRENPAFAPADVDAIRLCGTRASLSLPDLALWRHDGEPAWDHPLQRQALAHGSHDPYDEQLRHWRAVVDGHEAPRCSVLDGWHTLRAARAVLQAAGLATLVELNENDPLGEHRCPV